MELTTQTSLYSQALKLYSQATIKRKKQTQQINYKVVQNDWLT